jgi:AcrR family transcriptional regulator
MMRMGRAKRGTGRDALLNAAMQLISDRGLQGLTMRDIATVAEMSLGLTTYHFPDKDALLRETLQRFVDTEVERYESLLADLTETHASVEEILDALIAGIHATFRRPGYTVALLEVCLAGARDSAMSAIATRCIDGYRQATEQALIASGVPPDQARRTARWALTLVDGFATQAAARGTPTELPADIGDAIRTLAAATCGGAGTEGDG